MKRISDQDSETGKVTDVSHVYGNRRMMPHSVVNNNDQAGLGDRIVSCYLARPRFRWLVLRCESRQIVLLREFLIKTVCYTQNVWHDVDFYIIAELK